MAEGLNRVTLLGNLGADPELRYTQGGQAVLNIRLATTESYLDKDRVRKERTDWHAVVLWGKRGEALGSSSRRGRRSSWRDASRRRATTIGTATSATRPRSWRTTSCSSAAAPVGAVPRRASVGLRRTSAVAVLPAAPPARPPPSDRPRPLRLTIRPTTSRAAATSAAATTTSRSERAGARAASAPCASLLAPFRARSLGYARTGTGMLRPAVAAPP